MDDVFGIKRKSIGVYSLTGLNISYLISGGHELFFACCSINGAVRTTADSWLWIGGVDDSVSLDLCYIISDDLKWHAETPRYCSFVLARI